ncbi:glycosyltransferase, partial [Limosilactobacillus sp. Sa3CUN2]
MQPLISFIIPVYNNSFFELEECIKSIKQITLLTYEVLIIDNNSDIEKSKVYKKLSNNDDKINYYYTKKKGVGKARNIGIKMAKGEYIFFADADDKIIPKFFNNLTINLNDRVDLYIFNILVKNSIKTSTLSMVTSNSQPYMSERELAYNIVIGFNLNNVFGRLFRRKFLIDNKIIFKDIKNGEDVLFMSDVIITNPLTKYINKNSYIYFEKVNNSNKRLINDPLGIYKYSKMTFELKKSLAQKLNIDTEDVLLR